MYRQDSMTDTKLFFMLNSTDHGIILLINVFRFISKINTASEGINARKCLFLSILVFHTQLS